MLFVEKIKIISINTGGQDFLVFANSKLNLSGATIKISYKEQIFDVLFGENIATDLEILICGVDPEECRLSIYTDIMNTLVNLSKIHTVPLMGPLFLGQSTNNNLFQNYLKIFEDAMIYVFYKSLLELQAEINILVNKMLDKSNDFNLQSSFINSVLTKFIEINNYTQNYIQNKDSFEKQNVYWIMLSNFYMSTCLLKLNVDESNLNIDKKLSESNTLIDERLDELMKIEATQLEELSLKTDIIFGKINEKQVEIENNINSNDTKTLTIMSLFTALIALLMTATGRTSSGDLLIVMVFMTVLFVTIRVIDSLLNIQKFKANLNIILVAINFVMCIVLGAIIFTFVLLFLGA